MNNEKTEKQLISLILESSKYSKYLGEKYLPKTKKLFESVFYQEEISSPVKMEDCRNNKLYYFNQVKNKLTELYKQTNKDSIQIINESLASPNFKTSIDTFIKDLSKEINNLKFQNDFDKIDSLNIIIKSTINFSGRNIFVNGFNIQQLLDSSNIIAKELLEKFGANISTDLKLLLFNKSDKEIYFFFERKQTKEKTIIYYNLNDNELDYLQNKDFQTFYGSNKNNFFNDIWKNEKNYSKIIGQYINNNLYEIYRNPSLYEIKFEDNLYKDFAFQKREEQIKKQRIVK